MSDRCLHEDISNVKESAKQLFNEFVIYSGIHKLTGWLSVKLKQLTKLKLK